MRKIILVDIDGTLCREVCWTSEDCKNATPDTQLIKKVNALFEKEFVIIYTARKTELMQATMEWLNTHNIKYHAISNHKIPGDIYVDRDIIHPDDL